MMPPVTPFIGFGRWCFFTLLAPSTSTWSASTIRSTVPRLPLSRPVTTITSSPFLILCMRLSCLQHFRGKRNDLHEAFGAQLPRDRPEYACPDGLELGCEQHRCVRVESDHRAVTAAHALGRAHHDRVIDFAFLYPAARRRILDAHFDHIADAGIAALRAAQHFDAHDRA